MNAVRSFFLEARRDAHNDPGLAALFTAWFVIFGAVLVAAAVAAVLTFVSINWWGRIAFLLTVWGIWRLNRWLKG